MRQGNRYKTNNKINLLLNTKKVKQINENFKCKEQNLIIKLNMLFMDNCFKYIRKYNIKIRIYIGVKNIPVFDYGSVEYFPTFLIIVTVNIRL